MSTHFFDVIVTLDLVLVDLWDALWFSTNPLLCLFIAWMRWLQLQFFNLVVRCKSVTVSGREFLQAGFSLCAVHDGQERHHCRNWLLPLLLWLSHVLYCFKFDCLLFVERRGALPKLHRLRTSPKRYTYFGLAEPHTNHQIARCPSQAHCAWKSRAHTTPIFIISGAWNDFVDVDAKIWKIKWHSRRQTKSDTICGGNRRKEARF